MGERPVHNRALRVCGFRRPSPPDETAHPPASASPPPESRSTGPRISGLYALPMLTHLRNHLESNLVDRKLASLRNPPKTRRRPGPSPLNGGNFLGQNMTWSYISLDF